MSKIEVNQISSQCGSTLTIGQSGDTIQLACGATQTGFGRTGTVDWDTTAKTTSFTAVSGNGYFVNTTSGAVTVTLPASPSAGDIVSVSDYAKTALTNSITIARNGSNIEGAASDLVIQNNGVAMTFVYVDGTKGWKVVSAGAESNKDPVASFITATGGTITCCGDYKIHTFTGPGTFTVTCAGNSIGSNTVDYMIVAGGGAGGVGCSGGGGGAGGFRESSGCGYCSSPLGACVSALPITIQGYPVTVGGGGTGQSPFIGLPSFPSPTKGGSGSNSIFSTITSAGGGGGGGNNAQPGDDGGSGGGGGHFAPGNIFGAGNTPPVSPPQGNPGANPAPGTGSAPSDSGGGGGGATSGASNCGAPGPTGHAGGAGATTAISGSSTAYAGGGGGTNRCGGGVNDTDGGVGGGGKGGYGPRPTPVPQGSGVSGTTNTGGGGGGGKALTADPASRPYGGSGNGGSGIVIIRYKYQ